jgi:catechol 2,3-dioxygenase-like lactoylglutathione lyase family enzyme
VEDREPSVVGLHHAGVSVTDLAVSEEWYGRVFGLRRIREVELPGVTKVVLSADGRRPLLSLNLHDANAGEDFVESRTGLDHFAFLVGDPEELTRWRSRFDELGVDHSEIKHSPFGELIVLRDPDNIQLEVFAPAP